MPIDTEKAGDPSSHRGAMPYGEEVMKNRLAEELFLAIEKMSEDKKRQVAKFIHNLTASTLKSAGQIERQLSPAESAAIEQQLETLCGMAKGVGPFDVLKLMEDIRR